MQRIVKTNKENPVNKRVNRFNRKFERRLKRQVRDMAEVMAQFNLVLDLHCGLRNFEVICQESRLGAYHGLTSNKGFNAGRNHYITIHFISIQSLGLCTYTVHSVHV